MGRRAELAREETGEKVRTENRSDSRQDSRPSPRPEGAGAPPAPLADTLTKDELNFQADPPKRPREPIPVLAWLRVKGIPIHAPAECLEFTSKAALVRYAKPGNPPEQVWVWANAVTRRQQ